VAIAVYGAAGIVVALLGQAGTTVRGAYDVLVSMSVISLFLPYLFLFSAMIAMQSHPAPPEARRVPGGKPVAILLASIGLISTAVTIVLSVIPAGDETNKPLAVAKVVGGTGALVGLGVCVFLFSRFKARTEATRARWNNPR
jgi:amino acid transporter